MIRYGLVSLATILGVALLCARFGLLPGLVISALFCLAGAFLMSALTPDGQRAVELDLTRRAKRFQALGREIQHHETAPLLSSIGDRVHELVQHIRRDPKHLELAEELIHHHLPKAQSLVEAYVRLVGQPNLGARQTEELAGMESTIRLLDSALETQNRRCLAQDVDNFNLDRRGFEEVLRLDYPSMEQAAVGRRSGSRNSPA